MKAAFSGLSNLHISLGLLVSKLILVALGALEHCFLFFTILSPY